MGYAGDISVQESWDLLKSDPSSVLIDVRTTAEWTFVGVVDLSSLKKRALLIEWQSYPSMAVNTQFVSDVSSQVGADQTVLCLCRSGARSAAAAAALTAAGFETAYNIAAGFEGDVGPGGHRASLNGWKSGNLPWRQN
ncbi:MAG: rhodanese-like domain-containing protein [Pseudomonadota bacterium]